MDVASDERLTHQKGTASALIAQQTLSVEAAGLSTVPTNHLPNSGASKGIIAQQTFSLEAASLSTVPTNHLLDSSASKENDGSRHSADGGQEPRQTSRRQNA